MRALLSGNIIERRKNHLRPLSTPYCVVLDGSKSVLPPLFFLVFSSFAITPARNHEVILALSSSVCAPTTASHQTVRFCTSQVSSPPPEPCCLLLPLLTPTALPPGPLGGLPPSHLFSRATSAGTTSMFQMLRSYPEQNCTSLTKDTGADETGPRLLRTSHLTCKFPFVTHVTPSPETLQGTPTACRTKSNLVAQRTLSVFVLTGSGPHQTAGPRLPPFCPPHAGRSPLSSL